MRRARRSVLRDHAITTLSYSALNDAISSGAISGVLWPAWERNSMTVPDEYIVLGGHRQVEGWIDEGALSFLMLINRYQMDRDIMGAVAEIGVHHGRSFIALSALRRPDEYGVAVDIFENQALNPDSSGRGDYGLFVSNLETFGVPDRQVILKRDSLTLSGTEIIAAAHGQQVRLFSVDGSHTAKHTANDLEVAADALTREGIVVLDDWFNPDWPGVQEGFFAFFRQRERNLAPFAYGNNKLYLTRQESHGDHFRFVDRSVRPFAKHCKEVVLADFSCHHLLLPAPDVVATSIASAPPTVLDVARPTASAGTLGPVGARPRSGGDGRSDRRLSSRSLCHRGSGGIWNSRPILRASSLASASGRPRRSRSATSQQVNG